jgi:ABC-type Co2+ transport system permease subunit
MLLGDIAASTTLGVLIGITLILITLVIVVGSLFLKARGYTFPGR